MLEYRNRSTWNRQEPFCILNAATTLSIRLFAEARERVNAEFIELHVYPPLTVAELKIEIGVQFQSLKPIVEFSRIAIDNDFVPDALVIDTVHCNSLFALIPPVSGG